jgi:hypothetical protein
MYDVHHLCPKQYNTFTFSTAVLQQTCLPLLIWWRDGAVLEPHTRYSSSCQETNGVSPRWFVCCIAMLPCGNIILSSSRQHVVLKLFAYWSSYRAHAAWTTY